MTDSKFTEDDLDNCWIYYKDYLLDILNGDYELSEAREDLKGLIGSKWDRRTKAEILNVQPGNDMQCGEGKNNMLNK